jgi:hypothetical protein
MYLGVRERKRLNITELNYTICVPLNCEHRNVIDSGCRLHVIAH